MTLQEGRAGFRGLGESRVILILDASESAAQFQREIVSLARSILFAVPARMGRGLYFLGNPQPYSPEHLERQSANWFRENRGRASLVTPIWENLDPGELSTIVLIGSGVVFDLEDWVGTELFRRVLLVSVGNSLQGESPWAEELVHPALHEILPRLHDPLARVEIAGPAFMPTWWDNPGYRLSPSPGRVALVGEHLEDYRLCLSFLAAAGVPPRAHVARASGQYLELPLAETAPGEKDKSAKGQLDAGEAAIVQRALRRESFPCPHCGRQHTWDTLLCTHGAALLGEPVYPTLRDFGGFVLLRVDGAGVRYEKHRGTVLALGVEDVAVQEGSRAVVYRYNPQAGHWRRTGEALEPYYALGGDTYVVLF